MSKRDGAAYKEKAQKRQVRQGPGHGIYLNNLILPFTLGVMAIKENRDPTMNSVKILTRVRYSSVSYVRKDMPRFGLPLMCMG